MFMSRMASGHQNFDISPDMDPRLQPLLGNTRWMEKNKPINLILQDQTISPPRLLSNPQATHEYYNQEDNARKPPPPPKRENFSYFI